jgi:hypothetical protein
MIFPGMDPYLELPDLWSGVHTSLIVYIRDQLQPRLLPRYVAAIEERVYLGTPEHFFGPDLRVQRTRSEAPGPAVALAECDAPVMVSAPLEDVHEPYLSILDRRKGQRVVTVIEVLSPTNKYAGPGRDSYLKKQQEVLQSSSHLVEIDLLRLGPHVLAVPEPSARMRVEYDSLVCVNRLAHGEYNALLEEFYEHVIRPHTGTDGVTASLSGGQADLEHWMSRDTAELLRQFSASANRGTGASHPADRDRWHAFVISAHREGCRMGVSDLRRWLTEVDGWAPEVAGQLAAEYEYGRELLAFAGGHRRSA